MKKQFEDHEDMCIKSRLEMHNIHCIHPWSVGGTSFRDLSLSQPKVVIVTN